MKLFAEQIQYLRKRRAELLEKLNTYSEYCKNRENGGFDCFGAPHFLDYQVQIQNSKDRSELVEIDTMLRNGEFLVDRNFEMIDIGTSFSVDFGDGEIDQTILMDRNTTSAGTHMYASVDSDFGKAVLGKKVGDQVSYVVSSTGRKVSASISDIDRIRDHYLHFICEKDYTERVCGPVATEIQTLKREDPEGYQMWHTITPSQVDLLREELHHVKGKDTRRYSYIQKLLREAPVAKFDGTDRIQVGSIVDVLLQDGDNEATMHHFELVNRAVSTEIEGDYVERISTLGNAIYGLQEGDTFLVRRKHMPGIRGIVSSVSNQDVNQRVR